MREWTKSRTPLRRKQVTGARKKGGNLDILETFPKQMPRFGGWSYPCESVWQSIRIMMTMIRQKITWFCKHFFIDISIMNGIKKSSLFEWRKIHTLISYSLLNGLLFFLYLLCLQNAKDRSAKLFTFQKLVEVNLALILWRRVRY